MYYKLSALELELLARDRNKILRQFQESQETRRRSLKPPILVVPNDSSGLICFITRDEEEGSFSSQVRLINFLHENFFAEQSSYLERHLLRLFFGPPTILETTSKFAKCCTWPLHDQGKRRDYDSENEKKVMKMQQDPHETFDR